MRVTPKQGPDLKPAIGRLKAIAATSAKRPLLAEGPPHPDVELLDLCAKVLDLRAQHDAIWRAARELSPATTANPEFRAEMEKRDACVTAWKPLLSRIGKIPSRTGAGVYAKALLIRGSYGTAPMLSVSLAEDLVACPGLRSSLWPIGEEG